jgi:hypothetical protein
MTANELADALEKWREPFKFYINMLCQQAKEIEFLQNDIVKQQEFVCQQQSEIEALKKELALQKLSDISQEIENEPVAWVNSLDAENWDLYTPSDYEKYIKDDSTFFPLYTHANEDRDSAIYATGYWKGIEYKKPRELTDEEIAMIWDDVRKDANLKPSMKDVQDFARTILAKACK